MSNSDTKEIERKKFYRAFEECHRGSRELIKKRMKVYLPFVLPLKSLLLEPNALDLGCGRGEWLELLAENGFNVHGVDIDEGMLAACQERSFSVSNEDIVEYLKKLPSESQVLVSAFHLVEHIPFMSLQCLVQESLRVLKPGGLLILETPNTENLIVGCRNFYLDPTHRHPVPLQLLSFLTNYFGFGRTKELRLQETPNLENLTDVPLISVLAGVSPDCAVVAQKEARRDWLDLFAEPFAKEYGITLETMAQKYDINISQNISRLEDRLVKAEMNAVQAETKADQAEVRANEANIRAEQAEARASEAWRNFNMIASSHSWRLTYPLRILGKGIRWFIRGSASWIMFTPHSRPRRSLQSLLIVIKNYANSKPWLKEKILSFLGPFPKLKNRLKRIAYSSTFTSSLPERRESEILTSRAQEIHCKLQQAVIERQRKKGNYQ